MEQQQNTAPRPNMMIGITHTADGRKIIKEAKTLKIGIGFPRGKACDVFVNTDGKWVIRIGKKGGDGKLAFSTFATVDTREQAEQAFRKAWKTADVCTYPRKVAYFQFTRKVMGEDGAEIYIPDFAAIEAHSFIDKEHPGPPTEIDIVFLDDDVFTGSFQNWSASELKCSGDGENALRVLAMASTDEEKELAKVAAAAGKKHFPIVAGCWTHDCPYSKEGVDARGKPTPAPCKPGAEIKFQLSRNIRVGGTAFFHTSSYKSIPQIFSSIERIKELTGGRLAGIPLKMVLRSHKTMHAGVSAVQQNVSIEFRAEDMDSLRKNLIEQAWKFRAAAGLPEPTKSIAAVEDAVDMEALDGQSSMSAQDMANEFYPEDTDAEDDAITSEPPPPAAAATQAKQDSIADKLKAQRIAPVAEAPQAQSTAPPPLMFPWSDRAGMNHMLSVQKDRTGEAAFNAVLSKHRVMMGSLRADDPVALKVLTELMASPTVGNKAAEQSAGSGSGDMF